MNMSKYTNLLRGKLASSLLDLKIALLMIVIVVSLLLILFGVGFGTYFGITHYYPEYAHLLHDKHSILAGAPLIMGFLAFIVLSPFIMLISRLVVKYQINSIRQQSQEKISGVARITVDDWTHEGENFFYVTVPDRRGRLWTFRVGSMPKHYKSVESEGEFLAEIYFREAVESPSLVVINGNRELLPQSSPEMKDAPCRPSDTTHYTEAIYLLIFTVIFIAMPVWLWFGNLSFILSHSTSLTLEELWKVIVHLIPLIFIAIIGIYRFKKFFEKYKKSSD